MTSSVPTRRHAIADDLRNQILTGQLKPGERLPAEAQLAAQFLVSTATLRNALAVLQAEGLVEKMHGKGNFVRRSLRRITYLGGKGTLDPQTVAEAASRFTVHGTTVRAHGPLPSLLKMPAGGLLVELSCISHEGESPHGLARIYIPHDLAPVGVLDNASLHREAVTRFPVLSPPPATVRETVCARPPTPDEATTLQTNSAMPMLAITRIATDATGRVVEAALLVFPWDRVEAVFTTHHMIDERQAQG
ncbi:GntR family transcriptional regulator [Streptomyces sp. NPDC058739]|uniref:GntR family transcriptional regulator n=1 Tax=Streptomyces sp. NPDC058739 TaxID=3346618 RepID=UPI0036951904